MTTSRVRALSIALVALLASACLVVGMSAAEASSLPQSVPLRATFVDMFPGDSAHQAWTVDIPNDARVAKTDVVATGPGVAHWTATLCPRAGGPCVDLLAVGTGTVIDAGAYDLGIGVTLVSIDPGQSQSLDGRITLVESGGGSLAMTGADSVVPLLLAAAAACALGLLLVVLARRRRDDDDDTSLSNGARS
ncbi:LPXTG cell wall anchor domain-containing protein [Cellulomonas sp. McL0617]|uniref:LPXTG cell wall anchor domain-containing protein n=1 Tax=Cellulomonas sp. McL0617 TaxID=3415675 RepID=UPI003CE7BFDD